MIIWRTLDRVKKTGTAEDRPGRGRKRQHRTPGIIKKIREKIRRNPKRSIRKMARDHDMSAAHKKIDDLKRSLISAWQKIPDAVVRAAVRDFRRRLAAAVKAGGGHFE